MRFLSPCLALAALLATPPAIAENAATAIHAGPVFTRGATAGATGVRAAGAYPQYPAVAIQVELPPEANRENITPANFRLTVDNGAPVNATNIQSLASTGFGVAVSVSLDVSGSMRGAPLNAVRSGLAQFVNQAGPQDKIAVQTIADDGRWDANWDDSPDQVRTALNGLATRGSLTRLWDSLLQAIGHFPPMPLSLRLIVISDGHDEGSTHSVDDVIAAATVHSIIVDAIGVTRSNPVYLQGLARLADQTGGQFRQAKQTSELEHLVSSGIDGVRATPVVSFLLSNPPADAGSHRIHVIWSHDGTASSADVVAAVPPLPSAVASRWWLWAIGAGAGLLLIAGIVLIAARSRRRAVQAPPPVQAPAVATLSVPPPPFPAPPPSAFAPIEETMRVLSVQQPLEPRSPPAVPVKPVQFSRQRTEIYARFPTPADGRPAAWLLCEDGFAPGERFPIDKMEYWIGTLENNHLQIPNDPTVSGNHACLVFDHDVLGVYDYRSTNGTMVNGRLLEEARQLLQPGDAIRIGRSTFRLQIAGEEGASL